MIWLSRIATAPSSRSGRASRMAGALNGGTRVSNAICSGFPPPSGWAESHRTHPAITQAIFAVSNEERCPDVIWADPTNGEWLRISELVAEYVCDGDFALDSGRFAWGQFETLRLWPRL